MSLEDHWDEWLGSLALAGVDPRRWDLVQLLAAWEVQLQRSCKDESEWRSMRARLYAPQTADQPSRGARGRSAAPRAAQRPRGVGMDAAAAEALIARMNLADAQYR